MFVALDCNVIRNFAQKFEMLLSYCYIQTLLLLSRRDTFYSHKILNSKENKQECIPVGCIPPAH